MEKLDAFTQAYLEAMLWSSTVEPFAECASCGKDKPLAQFDTDGEGPEWTLCSDCGGDPSKNNYEPPADDNYDISDLSPEAFTRAIADCQKFQADNAKFIDDEHLIHGRSSGECSVDEKAGHDFWLTRCGHGAGFWDGDWTDEADEALTSASKAFGEQNLYVGDDGKLYLS